MGKKWSVITVISLILIALEVTSVFVFILPGFNKNEVFAELTEGDSEDAQEIIDKLSDKDQDKVKDLMDDFATYKCNEYAEGKLSYKKLTKILKAIDDMDGYYDFTYKYYTYAASREIIKLCDDAYKEYKSNGKSMQYYSYQTEISDIYYDVNTRTGIDEELEKNINDRYQQFTAGLISFEEISEYMEVVNDLYVGNAYYTASDISYKLNLIKEYQQKYDEVKAYFDNNQYFEAIDACNNAYISEDDTTGYYDKFEELKKEAYETGKTYYIEEAMKLADANKNEEAKSLIAKIKEVYGDEVDTKEVEKKIIAPWMLAYVKYVDNLENNLKKDMTKGVKIGDCDDSSLIDVDKNMPTLIYLYDFDGDKIPEMLLSNETYYYIISFDGKRAVFTGCVKIATTCDVPYLITIPTKMEEGYTGYALLEFKDKKWNVINYYYAADDASEFIVNGKKVSLAECKDMHDEIAGYENKDIVISDANYIDQYETFIYDYEN